MWFVWMRWIDDATISAVVQRNKSNLQKESDKSILNWTVNRILLEMLFETNQTIGIISGKTFKFFPQGGSFINKGLIAMIGNSIMI